MPTTPTASGPIVEYQDTPIVSSTGMPVPIFTQFLPIREVTTNDEINVHNVYRPFNLLETVFNMEPQIVFLNSLFRDDATAVRNNKQYAFGMGANFNNSNNLIQNSTVASVSHINIARGNISALASHLGVSIPASLNQQVTTNSTVRAQDWNDVILTARDCWNHRLDGWKTATVEDGPTVSMNEVPDTPGSSSNSGISFRYNFSSIENLRRFFTVGGAIGLQFVSSPHPLARAATWSNIFDAADTVRLSAFQVDVNRDTGFLAEEGALVGGLFGNYETRKYTINSPRGFYHNNIILWANTQFYEVGWNSFYGDLSTLDLRINLEIGMFIDNGYSCIVLEPGFDFYSDSVSVSRNVTAKVWQPNATLASFLPNFENPTVTASPYLLQHTPLSFRQP